MGETRRQRPSVERLATGGFRPRLCENSNDRRQSINFSLFFGRFPPLQARRSEKVRFRCAVFRQFPSFHTAWTQSRPRHFAFGTRVSLLPAHARISRLLQKAARKLRALLTERDGIFDAAVTIAVTLSSL